MYYSSRKEFFNQLKHFKEIGFGSQGTCYYDYKTKKVFKIFNQFLDPIYDDDIIHYSESEIMKFSHIQNATFIFPNDTIVVEDEIFGYITSFIEAKNLYSINPLLIDLNDFISKITPAYSDIEKLSESGVVLFDLTYNTMYGKSFYVTDTDEFGYSKKNPLSFNINAFNIELYLFIIDGYFDTFIKNYDNLRRMYEKKDEDLIYFLKLLKKYLSEYLDKDIHKLNDAKKVIQKKRHGEYERLIRN